MSELGPAPGECAGSPQAEAAGLWRGGGGGENANAAEETANPQRDVAFGFGAAMVTLALLAVLVFVAAVGGG